LSQAAAKRFFIHDLHVKAGARLGAFGEWEVPLYYSSILEEHEAVRTAAGVFDISHMGEFFVSGREARGFLDSLLPRRMGRLVDGRALYAPLLGWLEARPWTAWLTAFFLPHITYTGSPLLTALAWLGPVLLTLGLGIFLVCAAQVYSAKLFRRGVVTGGLYRSVRHPQYLGLGVAGLGLLLYWPRFVILVLYVSMV